MLVLLLLVDSYDFHLVLTQPVPRTEDVGVRWNLCGPIGDDRLRADHPGHICLLEGRVRLRQGFIPVAIRSGIVHQRVGRRRKTSSRGVHEVSLSFSAIVFLIPYVVTSPATARRLPL